MNRALFTCNKDNWLTPESVLDRVREVGPIGLDPCTTLGNPTGAAEWHTDDGTPLGERVWPQVASWGVVFMNPPYSEQQEWVARACGHAAEYGAAVLSLIPARTDTRLWHRIVVPNAAAICFWRGRLRFRVWTEECAVDHAWTTVDLATGCATCAVRRPSSAPFPSAVVLHRGANDGMVERFTQAFGDAGWIVTP